MPSPPDIRGILFQYAAKFRMNGRDDREIVGALAEVGVAESDAQDIVRALDDSGVTSESNSQFTAIGCSSGLLAIVVTLAAAWFLVQLFQPLIIKSVIVVLSVAAGFAAHVAFSYSMEKLGVKMSRVVPVEIPDKKEILRRLDEIK